jgi:hypothetical protein
MADLFDVNPAARDPQNSEPIKNGAYRIRTLKDTLQQMLTRIFLDNTPTFNTDQVPSSLLAASSLGDGLAKPNSSAPVQVNYDGVSLSVDSSTPKKLIVNTKVSSLLTIANSGATSVYFAHGFGSGTSIPSLVRWVYVCQTAELGYSVGDEVEVDSANIVIAQSGIGNPYQGYVTTGGTVSFYGYRPTRHADGTNCYITIPDGTIYLATKQNSGGVAPTYGLAITRGNWKLKAYAWAF